MTQQAGDLSSLQALPLFASLCEERKASLFGAALRRRYGAHARIYQSGAGVDALYVILSGAVNLLLEDGHGREVVIDTVKPSGFFGEAALFSAAPEMSSARVHQSCELLHIPKPAALEWLAQDRRAMMLVAQSLAVRLAQVHRQLADMAFVDVYGRVARVLLDHSREADGDWLCDVPCAQLAALVGASREMVSRVIGAMVHDGALRRDRRRLTLIDRPALFARTLHGRRLATGSR